MNENQGKPTHGRCEICECRTTKPLTLCYVHELYRGASLAEKSNARDALDLERWRAEMLAQKEARLNSIRAELEMERVIRMRREWGPRTCDCDRDVAQGEFCYSCEAYRGNNS